MRTGQIAAMLLTALALEGCYAQYNYRPAGYEEGWTMGHHAGHLGWYDQHGRWQGWFDGAAWHDAHETVQHGASSPLSARPAPVGGIAPNLRGPIKSPVSPSVSSQEEAPSAVNPVPEAAQLSAPQPAPITPRAPSAAVPATRPAVAPAVPTQTPPALTPPRTPTPSAVTPVVPQPPAPASVPATQPEPVVQTPPVQPAPAPAPSAQPPAPAQTPDEDETAPSTSTTQQAPFKVKPGSSMPQGPDESTSAASQVLPAWLSPSPDPVPTSQTPSGQSSSGQSSGRTTHKTTR
ncbi:hypothetical protein [Acetobacter sicerae]|uniref:hypothetical protein n=1 Tax=Acetobacter sicerae TaxID=85325 RepID=UPI00156B9215|nr:hypothetical protein [Acetobacter sicerae]NHN92834.1 hypothetical protein [Acetobacter sicerae]